MVVTTGDGTSTAAGFALHLRKLHLVLHLQRLGHRSCDDWNGELHHDLLQGTHGAGR